MLRNLTRFAALAGILVLPLAACEDDATGPEAQARLSVFITDAPGDVHAAVVTISRVEILGTAAAEEGADGDAETDNVIVLTEEEWTGDLVELQNQVDALVSGATIPAGRYRELRIVITEACIEVETESGSDIYSSSSDFDACGEVDGELQMPSFGSSGLKVRLPGNGGMDITGTESLLLDFDVAQSFTGHEAGSRWVLSPVLRLERMEDAAAVQVSVTVGTGITLPTGIALENLRVQLDGEAAVALDASGSATFEHVTEGSHTITLLGPEGSTLVLTTEPASPHTFDVAADGSAMVALTITGVS